MKKIVLLFLLFTGIANAQLELPIPEPLYECDFNNNGFETFDLTVRDAEITAGLSVGFTVAHYETPLDAASQTNPIGAPSFYSNITPFIQTVYVRVNDTSDANNFGITPLTLLAVPTPAAFEQTMNVCDDNGDGFAAFPLNDLDSAVNGGIPAMPPSYHETMADAETGANPIVSPYVNIAPWQQTIYARVANSFCYTVVEIELHVEPNAIMPVLQNIVMPDGVNVDSSATFDLTVQDNDILSAQGSNPVGYTITYHHTQVDALSGTGMIFPANNYINTSNPETIWVAVTSDLTGCRSIPGSFQLIVAELGIGEQTQNRLKIAPNPVKDVLHITSETQIDAIELIDILGRSISLQPQDGNETNLDLSGFATGIYALRITTDSGMVTRKLIKE